MRGSIWRTAVVTVVLCPVVAGAPVPANADRAGVEQRSCEASGGVFAKRKGVKSCTRSEQVRVVSPVLTRTVRVEGGPRTGPSVDLIGTYQVVQLVETTTTRSQRGNQEVVTASSRRELATTVEPLTCRRALADLPEPRPTVEDSIASCAGAGVYPT